MQPLTSPSCRTLSHSVWLQVMGNKKGRKVATGGAAGRPRSAADSTSRRGVLSWIPWAAAEVPVCECFKCIQRTLLALQYLLAEYVQGSPILPHVQGRITSMWPAFRAAGYKLEDIRQMDSDAKVLSEGLLL